MKIWYAKLLIIVIQKSLKKNVCWKGHVALSDSDITLMFDIGALQFLQLLKIPYLICKCNIMLKGVAGWLGLMISRQPLDSQE